MPKKIYKYKRKPTRSEYIFFKTISNILIMGGVIFILLAFGPVVKDEVWWIYKEIKSQTFLLSTNKTEEIETVDDSIFSRLLSTKPIAIEPVNRDFSIVIEKIGVNAPVVIDVPITNEEAYNSALKEGIAHAGISNYLLVKASKTQYSVLIKTNHNHMSLGTQTVFT